MDEETEQRRLILPGFLSSEECKELEFIHKSSSTVGYRPNVFSTTLSHLIATRSPHFLLPFVAIRERVKEKVEEFFGCEFQLCVEFTGLISWCRGASIGWHSDDNRPYLKQRDFTAVCYLNSYGKDFTGGLFHFQDGEPTTIVPMAGDVVIYTADTRNIHSVDEIIKGERLTLALWFTRNGDHDEDTKLISLLSEDMLLGSINVPKPFSASNNMYWFSQDATNQESGFDIRCARLDVLGFDIYSSQERSSGMDVLDLLMQPLQVARGSELYELEFVSVLHALQVVQFYCWKASEMLKSQFEVESSNVARLSQSQQERIEALKSLFIKELQLPEMVFGCISCKENWQLIFDWISFSRGFAAFEDYTQKLYKNLRLSLPYWRTHGIIYCVSCEGT